MRRLATIITTVVLVFSGLTTSPAQANIAMESGGYNQRMYETMAQMLIELRLMNIMLQEGLNIRRDDLQSMRDELTNNLSLDAIKEI